MISVCCLIRDDLSLVDGLVDATLPYLDKKDELVFVNGGRRHDKCGKRLSELANEHKNVKHYVRSQKNKIRDWKEEGKLRNDAWAMCKSKWILSLDADEAYSPTLFSMLDKMKRDKKYKAYYFPTINYYGSTKKIINPTEFPDFHIRFANKEFVEWVGTIHASLWRKHLKIPYSIFDKDAGMTEEYLYHYARVKGEVDRPYGKVPLKLIEYNGVNPRCEFDE